MFRLWQGNLGNTPSSSPAQWALLVAQGPAGPTGAARERQGPAGPTGATGLPVRLGRRDLR